MVKVVTLRCSECGNTYDFNIGAGRNLKNWNDAIGKITDKKELEKLKEAFDKATANKDASQTYSFSNNAAEALNNVNYSLCGEETISLVEEIPDEVAEAVFSEKVMESVDASQAKWAEVLKKEGVTAFGAIYLCPKSRNPKQGLHLSLRWKTDGGTKAYVARNVCPDCSSKMTLVNDGNSGFMHEGCTTVARCEKCNAPLVVDKVSFKIPTEG